MMTMTKSDSAWQRAWAEREHLRDAMTPGEREAHEAMRAAFAGHAPAHLGMEG